MTVKADYMVTYTEPAEGHDRREVYCHSIAEATACAAEVAEETHSQDVEIKTWSSAEGAWVLLPAAQS